MLINASPDLRAQTVAFAGLHPDPAQARGAPIRDVFLTNADLDHVLGLFLLREGRQTLRIHCTAAVRETLRNGLQMDEVLAGYCGARWHVLPEKKTLMDTCPGLSLRAIPLPGAPPRYAKAGDPPEGQSVALEFTDEAGGGKIVVAPDVAAITPVLSEALATANLVIFDGTFWSEGELRQIDPAARTASQMGHLPVSQGSLEVLRHLSARTRVYLHINNTNPILAPDSPERTAVLAAGIIVGEDGMEFEP